VVDGKMVVPVPLVKKWSRSILTCLNVETPESTCFLRVSGNFNQENDKKSCLLI